MTLAAVWRVDEFVYAIADTRISRPGGILTEHGPKLLPIRIACRSDTRVKYKGTIGFAYAGSTLSALATHALANTFLENLLAQDHVQPPDLYQVSFAIGQIGYTYMHEIGGAAGAGALFSAIVFGYCVRDARFRAFHIASKIEDAKLNVHVGEHDLYGQDTLLVIGSRPELLRERIKGDRPTYYAGVTAPKLIGLRETDLPRRALEALIREGADPSIGGAVQAALVTQDGFDVQAHLIKYDPPLPTGRNAGLTLLGFDTDGFSVGEHVVGRMGR